ncbi:hypothetical protein B0H21DRAFT_785651 [Amylocystis lapponica]|nr:hypothetical protein B0H21DRAFT_785651 [Amylocystis lapponica]
MPASPVHHASLVDPALHSPALMDMLEIDMSRTLIEYVVDNVIETVDYALGRASSSSRGRSLSRHSEHANFTTFVSDVLHKAEIKVPVLLAALVYIDRAKPHIQIALEKWACERVFLGALIVANKYLNDSTLKNVHWALCTGVFGKRDVGRIEREFLDVLDFELSISEADLLSHHSYIMAAVHPRVSARGRSRMASRPRARSPLRSRALSRWSDDSSDMDVDSDSSLDSLSPPCTPDNHDQVAYVPALPKHAHHPEHAPHFVDTRTPSRPHVADAPVYSHASSPYPHRPPPARTNTALQLLHSFPRSIPHLRSHTPASYPPAPSSCRPLRHAHSVAPHATQVTA